MNKCKHCNLSIYDSEVVCPLCHTAMDTTAHTVVEYPKYEDLITAKFILRHMLWFIAMATLLVCVYIRIFTQEAKIFWPVIIGATMLYCLAMLWVIRTKKKPYGAKIMYSYIFLSAFAITIDFITDFFLGSTDFIFPFLTLAAIIYLTVLAVRSKRLFSEYFGYMLAVLAIGLLSIPIYLLGLNEYEWGAFIALASSALIAIGLYLFADKNLKEEVKKRFHR